MGDQKRDTALAFEASKVILDGRDPVKDGSSILITMDGVIAAILLLTQGGDSRKAAAMLNEGTVPSVEERLALRHARMERGE